MELNDQRSATETTIYDDISRLSKCARVAISGREYTTQS